MTEIDTNEAAFIMMSRLSKYCTFTNEQLGVIEYQFRTYISEHNAKAESRRLIDNDVKLNYLREMSKGGANPFTTEMVKESFKNQLR